MSALPAPSPAMPDPFMPALDDARPIIGPNLAGNPALCSAVAEHIYRDFFYAYYLQQQRLWPTWDRLDDAFRVAGKRDDLDISTSDIRYAGRNPDKRGDGLIDRNDGRSKVYPPDFHQQVRNKTDTHMSISWGDGKLPVRAKKPDTLYENPVYNPVQQAVDTINELLKQCANAINMKARDRKVRGSWSKVGHAWAHVDFKYRIQQVPETMPLPMDQYGALMAIQQGTMAHGGQAPAIELMNGQQVATWYRPQVDPDSMITDFVPIRYDSVFIDQTLSADEMECQPCPIVRRHITRFDLWGYDYDPNLNPFGWLNCQQALAENSWQWTLSEPDEGNLRTEMQKKHGLTDAGLIRPINTMKQLWTCYPMLAIDPATGELDKGEGIKCPTCQGAKMVEQQAMSLNGGPQQFSTMPGVMPDTVYGAGDGASVSSKVQCPDCNGLGKKFIKPERYVVEMFGRMMGASNAGQNSVGLTVLRIQRNPTVKDKVPLLYGAHLTEDTAGAIPLSVSEASLKAVDQLATTYNQYNNAKNQIVDRNILVQEDEDAAKLSLVQNGLTIKVSNINNAVKPMDIPSFDASRSCLEAAQMFKGDVQALHGFPPTLLGEVSPGRRAATEIQTASDSAKLPLTIEIDSCNTQIHGRWAQFHIDNIEAYAPRDWIREKTGRTTFGRVHLHCNMAEDYYSQQAMIQYGQYILQASVNDPTVKRAILWREYLKLIKFPNADLIADDGGQAQAQQQGFRIIAQILYDGIPVPPKPEDPHGIFITMFQQALDDDQLPPQFKPLLMQRMQIEMLMQQQQMLQQLQQQAQMQAMLAPPDGELPNNGQKPANGRQVPQNKTQGMQQMMGANAPQ